MRVEPLRLAVRASPPARSRRPARRRGIAPRSSYPGPDLDVLLDGTDELALEGVVLKHQAGPYRPGRRTTTWRKMKCPDWAEHRARRFDGHRRHRLSSSR